MSRPILLDLFAGEGGAAAGYHAAGFEVIGVDIEPMPHYPYTFIQGDAIEFAAEFGPVVDAIHASPPCQRYSTITPAANREHHADLIAPIREVLRSTGKPYVIENVAGARRELVDPMMLCGSGFGLEVRRHRLFESNVWLMSVPCDHANQGRPTGVYGDHGQDTRDERRPDGTRRGSKARNVEHAREAMGMPWASWRGATQAIPPAYTEFIGLQLIREMNR